MTASSAAATEAGDAGTANQPTAGPVPDPGGHFGSFGGRFAPEALLAALDELEAAYAERQGRPGVRRRARLAAARDTQGVRPC